MMAKNNRFMGLMASVATMVGSTGILPQTAEAQQQPGHRTTSTTRNNNVLLAVTDFALLPNNWVLEGRERDAVQGGDKVISDNPSADDARDMLADRFQELFKGAPTFVAYAVNDQGVVRYSSHEKIPAVKNNGSTNLNRVTAETDPNVVYQNSMADAELFRGMRSIIAQDSNGFEIITGNNEPKLVSQTGGLSVSGLHPTRNTQEILNVLSGLERQANATARRAQWLINQNGAALGVNDGNPAVQNPPILYPGQTNHNGNHSQQQIVVTRPKPGYAISDVVVTPMDELLALSFGGDYTNAAGQKLHYVGIGEASRMQTFVDLFKAQYPTAEFVNPQTNQAESLDQYTQRRSVELKQKFPTANQATRDAQVRVELFRLITAFASSQDAATVNADSSNLLRTLQQAGGELARLDTLKSTPEFSSLGKMQQSIINAMARSHLKIPGEGQNPSAQNEVSTQNAQEGPVADPLDSLLEGAPNTQSVNPTVSVPQPANTQTTNVAPTTNVETTAPVTTQPSNYTENLIARSNMEAQIKSTIDGLWASGEAKTKYNSFAQAYYQGLKDGKITAVKNSSGGFSNVDPRSAAQFLSGYAAKNPTDAFVVANRSTIDNYKKLDGATNAGLQRLAPERIPVREGR